MPGPHVEKAFFQILTTVTAGLILTLLVADCRQRREMHEDIIRMKETMRDKLPSPTPTPSEE
jgi:hypothetical protein